MSVKDNMTYQTSPEELAEQMLEKDREYSLKVAKAIIAFDEIDARDFEEREFAPQWMKEVFKNHFGHVECDNKNKSCIL